MNPLPPPSPIVACRLYTGIHAKPKPKFKSGAISESTTALNVDQTNTSVLSADVKTTSASAALPVPVTATRGNSQEQAATSVIASATVVSTASAPQKKEAKAVVDKKKIDARKKSLKRL